MDTDNEKVYMFDHAFAMKNKIRIPQTPGKIRMILVESILIAVVLEIVVFHLLLALDSYWRGFGYLHEILQSVLIAALFIVPVFFFMYKRRLFLYTQTALVEINEKLYFTQIATAPTTSYMGYATPIFIRNNVSAAKENLQNEAIMSKQKTDSYSYVSAVKEYLNGVRNQNQVICLDECYLLGKNEKECVVAYKCEQNWIKLEIKNVFPDAFPKLSDHVKNAPDGMRAKSTLGDLFQYSYVKFIFILVFAAILFPMLFGFKNVVEQETNYQKYVKGKSYQSYITDAMLKDLLDEKYDHTDIQSAEVELFEHTLVVTLKGTVTERYTLEISYSNELNGPSLNQDQWCSNYQILPDADTKKEVQMMIYEAIGMNPDSKEEEIPKEKQMDVVLLEDVLESMQIKYDTVFIVTDYNVDDQTVSLTDKSDENIKYKVMRYYDESLKKYRCSEQKM